MKWLLACLGLIVLVSVAVTVFRVSISNIFFAGALLACPLMHLWIMKNDGHKH